MFQNQEVFEMNASQSIVNIRTLTDGNALQSVKLICDFYVQATKTLIRILPSEFGTPNLTITKYEIPRVNIRCPQGHIHATSEQFSLLIWLAKGWNRANDPPSDIYIGFKARPHPD